MCDAEKLRELEQETAETFRQLAGVAGRIVKAGLEGNICPEVTPVLLAQVAEAAVHLDILQDGLGHLAAWNDDPDVLAEPELAGISSPKAEEFQKFLQQFHGRN